MQNKVIRMENMKDVEYVSLKKIRIDHIGILDGKGSGGNRKCLKR